MGQDEKFLQFIFKLLSMPEPHFGIDGYPGLSTKCIQWMLGYMIEYEQGEVRSFRQLSLYLGFNPMFHVGVFTSLRSFEAEILGRKGGVIDEN